MEARMRRKDREVKSFDGRDYRKTSFSHTEHIQSLFNPFIASYPSYNASYRFSDC